MSKRSLFLLKWLNTQNSSKNFLHSSESSPRIRPWLNRVKNCFAKRDQKPVKILHVATTQCNVYISQRLRRLHKIYLLYQQAYNEHASAYLFLPLFKRLVSSRGLPLVLGACGFKWNEQGISDDEMQRQIQDLMMLQNAQNRDREIQQKMLPEIWENVLNEANIRMWRYPCQETGLMEYKVHGTFNDITARAFFNLQIDIEYRKLWDDLVVKIEVIDEQKSRNEQVLQWVSHFSYPLSPREYLCSRRTLIDEKNNIMVISARSVSHPKCQPCKKFVRVTSYISHMVIKPHKTFDDAGFDYLMTYSDDPQTVFPTRVTSWVITAGVPDYIKKLHNACLLLNTDKNDFQENQHSSVCLTS